MCWQSLTGERAFRVSTKKLQEKGSRAMAVDATQPYDDQNIFAKILRDEIPCRKEIGRAHAELQSLMRISYAVFCLKKKNIYETKPTHPQRPYLQPQQLHRHTTQAPHTV